jgi:hypothetical protein
MPVITQWASRAPWARGTADRTGTLGEPDPAEAVTGQFESVEVGRAVLLVVEQIDQLPGRAHRCRERGRSPAGRRGCARTARCPWWCRVHQNLGRSDVDHFVVTDADLGALASLSSMRCNQESGESGSRQGTAACGAAPAQGPPLESRSAVGHPSGEMPMSAGPEEGRGGTLIGGPLRARRRVRRQAGQRVAGPRWRIETAMPISPLDASPPSMQSCAASAR